jgi:ribonuclease P protein component
MADCAIQATAPARLRRRSEFVALRKGNRVTFAAFVIRAGKRDDAACGETGPRFGVTVTKQTGNSVIRNRIRRRLREAIRMTGSRHGLPGHDYVLIAREAALTQDFAAVVEQLAEGLDRVNRSGAIAPRNRVKRPA